MKPSRWRVKRLREGFSLTSANHQWDIPALRELLEEVIPQNTRFDNFEVDHTFPHIGRKRVLLNARRIYRKVKARIGYSSHLRTSPSARRWRRRSKVLKLDTGASLKQPKMNIDPRCRDRADIGCESLPDRNVGLFAWGVFGQETLGNWPI